MYTETFNLDTKGFEEAARKCDSLANKMTSLRGELSVSYNALMSEWHGKGASTFQKKYHIVEQQLKDVKEGVSDLAKSIRNASDSYIQADVAMSKSAPGVDVPGTVDR